jgi:hypothetical protein
MTQLGHEWSAGKATGVAVFVTELGPKRLQLLREVVPQAKLIALVVNLNSASGPLQRSEMQSMAQAMGQKLLVLSASTEREVDEAFAMTARKVDAIVVRSEMPEGETRFLPVRQTLIDYHARALAIGSSLASKVSSTSWLARRLASMCPIRSKAEQPNSPISKAGVAAASRQTRRKSFPAVPK